VSTKRDGDEGSKSWFRSSRVFQQDGSWFFLTREGRTEGPFGGRNEAERMLDNYINVVQSGMLSPDNNLDLSVLPKE
jgi:hypothetical protein